MSGYKNIHTASKNPLKQSIFANLAEVTMNRSVFPRSFVHKTTFDAGRLIPFYYDNVYPGDTIKLGVNSLVRMTTPVVPLMDNVYLQTFFFFVPFRLVWDHFERFMGDQPDGPDQSIDFQIPQATINNLPAQSIGDYFGLPTGVNDDLDVMELPLRAYCAVYNQWFKNENLIDSYNIDLSTGGMYRGDAETTVSVASNVLSYASDPVYRMKRRDYFTSALPFVQKGDPVTIGIGGITPITFAEGTGDYLKLTLSDTGVRASTLAEGVVGRLAATGANAYIGSGTGSSDIYAAVGTNLVADSSEGAGVTVNELRLAFQTQKILERFARAGTRYREQTYSFFGVQTADSRVQVPEFLGGTESRINVMSVAQSSSTDATTPQGNLSAYAVGLDSQHGFTKSFTEHGMVIGLVNVRTDNAYQQGINKKFLLKNRFDMYFPQFAHLGEQAILNKEIFAQGKNVKDVDGNVIDDLPFGYQERFAELRYNPNMITGKLRSTDAQTLDVWHTAQKFDSLPTLNKTFIEDSASYQGIARASAVQDEPQFVADFYFAIEHIRCLPVHGTPGLVDHF